MHVCAQVLSMSEATFNHGSVGHHLAHSRFLNFASSITVSLFLLRMTGNANRAVAAAIPLPQRTSAGGRSGSAFTQTFDTQCEGEGDDEEQSDGWPSMTVADVHCIVHQALSLHRALVCSAVCL